MDESSLFLKQLDEHARVLQATRSLSDAFAGLTARCVQAVRAGNTLLFFGNGGSASDAQHLATELTVRYAVDRAAIAALALTTDTSALTAIGNDLGFDHLFSRQIEALGRPGDVAIAITTSGKSPNILEGLRAARRRGLVTAALTGKGGGALPGLADILLIVPSDSTARIQEMHILLGHALCQTLEREFSSPNSGSHGLAGGA
ncbi:MAG: SIS domain-containing protein [Acidiferrobacteraceae bacterium]